MAQLTTPIYHFYNNYYCDHANAALLHIIILFYIYTQMQKLQLESRDILYMVSLDPVIYICYNIILVSFVS